MMIYTIHRSNYRNINFFRSQISLAYLKGIARILRSNFVKLIWMTECLQQIFPPFCVKVDFEHKVNTTIYIPVNFSTFLFLTSPATCGVYTWTFALVLWIKIAFYMTTAVWFFDVLSAILFPDTTFKTIKQVICELLGDPEISPEKLVLYPRLSLSEVVNLHVLQMEKKRQRLQQEAVEIIAAAGQDTMNDGNDDDGATEDSGHIEESIELSFTIDQWCKTTFKAITILLSLILHFYSSSGIYLLYRLL